MLSYESTISFRSFKKRRINEDAEGTHVYEVGPAFGKVELGDETDAFCDLSTKDVVFGHGEMQHRWDQRLPQLCLVRFGYWVGVLSDPKPLQFCWN